MFSQLSCNVITIETSTNHNRHFLPISDTYLFYDEHSSWCNKPKNGEHLRDINVCHVEAMFYVKNKMYRIKQQKFIQQSLLIVSVSFIVALS